WIKSQDRVLYTREDLAKLNITWVYDAVDMSGVKLMAHEHYSRDCMVVANGGPEIVDLSTLTVDDVESVEIYAAYPGGSPTVTTAQSKSKFSKIKTGGNFVAVDNARRAKIENGSRICPAVYVWLR